MQIDDNHSPDRCLCLEVLKHFAPGIVPHTVESTGIHGGFSGARIWRVTTAQGDFALRRWPNPGLPPDRLLGLHCLLQHLRSEGLTFVAVPLAADNGTTLVQFSGSFWQLEPWMPGTADFHRHPSGVRLQAAMTAMARWHLTAARYQPLSTHRQWFATSGPSPSGTVVERLSILGEADDRNLKLIETQIATVGNPARQSLAQRLLNGIRSGRSQIQIELQSVRDVMVPQQPCLRDVWHDHLLFVGDEVTGLIDPSACRTETVACDLSRLIGSLINDDGAAWQTALEVYERVRPLSLSERRLIPILDRSGVLLSGWTWLKWLHLERRQFSNAADVDLRLSTIVERMEHSMSDNTMSGSTLVLPDR